MEQQRRQFVADTEDLVEQIFAALDQLRASSDRKQQRALIDNIFRQVHRIKGSAASFGFAALSEFAHEFENLLAAMRAEQVAVSDDVLDACELASRALSESLTASGSVEPSQRELFETLRNLAQMPVKGVATDSSASLLSQLPSELSQALTEDEKSRIDRRFREGNFLCVLTTSFDLAGFDEQFYRLKEKLAERGEVISTSPAVDAKHPDKINFRILFSSSARFSDGQSSFADFPNLAITELTLSLPLTEDLAEEKTGNSSIASRAHFIRTDLDDLDRLISSAHELFRLTTRTLDLAQSIVPRAQGQTLDQLGREIRRSFLNVENELIGLRMVSLGPVLHRALRAGRSAARSSDKQVNFKIIGSDLRLDKLLSDAIADPLVHLVRNAVDHGIDGPAERIAAGKPAQGTVIIEATRVGSRTRVRVSDDGRGIDAAAVARVAGQLGLVDPSNQVDLNRSLRLIFRPGFSTLAAASTVSGRGVGLDIVETAVEQVGGEVRVSSKPGKSSIFEIRLPVTFSLLNSTVVAVGENCYCVGSSEVVKTEKVSAGQIAQTENGEALLTESGVVPLVRLGQVLRVAANEAMNDASVITCALPLEQSRETGELLETRNGKRLIGLLVDGVVGTEEVLVRNLGRHAGRWYGVAGATELRDGTIALVLDLPRLLVNARTKS